VLLHPVEQEDNGGIRVRLEDAASLVPFTVDPHDRVSVIGGSNTIS
jgi:hypothetical protein